MTTEKVTAMLLQILDKNTNTEAQNTQNGSQKIWSKCLKDQPVFAIREFVPCEVISQNIFHQIYEKTYLMKFLSKNASLLPCNDNIKDSITGIFLPIFEILWNSYSVM